MSKPKYKVTVKIAGWEKEEEELSVIELGSRLRVTPAKKYDDIYMSKKCDRVTAPLEYSQV